MRIKIALLAAGMAASAIAAIPASAQQPYRDSCEGTRSSNQGGGMILGGILGGLAGNQVAAKGRRSEGTAVGAILGGVLGSAIGGSRDNCTSYRSQEQVYYPPAPPPAPVYRNDYPSSGPIYRDDDYGNDDYRGRDDRSHRRNSDDRYDRGGYRDSDYVERECTVTPQTTRMPDGSKVIRDVEVCREIRAGDWHEN